MYHSFARQWRRCCPISVRKSMILMQPVSWRRIYSTSTNTLRARHQNSKFSMWNLVLAFVTECDIICMLLHRAHCHRRLQTSELARSECGGESDSREETSFWCLKVEKTNSKLIDMVSVCPSAHGVHVSGRNQAALWTHKTQVEPISLEPPARQKS